MSNSTQQPSPLNETSFIETTHQTSILAQNNDVLYNDYERPASDFTTSNIYENATWGVLVAIVVAGVIGNIFVWVLMSEKQLTSLPFAVYLKCMTISDTLFLALRLMENSERIFQLQSFVDINVFFCKTLISLKTLAMLLSPWLVVGLTLDRYVCVCYPLTRARLCTRKKAIIVCSTILAACFTLVIVALVEWEFEDGICIASQDIQYYYIFLRLLVSSVLPCFIILALNIVTVIRIQRSNNFRNEFIRSRTSANQESDSSTRPLVLISILAFVTLLPVSLFESVSILVGIYDTEDVELIGDVWQFLTMMSMLNYAQNFYILMTSSRKYRDIMRMKLGCCRVNANQQSSSGIGFSLSSNKNVHKSTTDVGLPSSSDITESTMNTSLSD